MSENKIVEAGDLRKYRIEIPNSVDDLGLDPYTVRLYMHLKRVAGPDGECWQSAETIANHCKMSTGQVSKSKQILKENDLITITEVEHEKPGRPYHLITIRDIWLHNFRKYAQTSPHDVQRSQGDLKNKPSKNEPSKKQWASAEAEGPEPKPIAERFEDVMELLRKRRCNDSASGRKNAIAATAEFCALCFGGKPEYGRIGRIAKKQGHRYRRICQVALESVARSPRGDPYSYLEACLKGGRDVKEKQGSQHRTGPGHYVANREEFEQARREIQQRKATAAGG